MYVIRASNTVAVDKPLYYYVRDDDNEVPGGGSWWDVKLDKAMIFETKAKANDHILTKLKLRSWIAKTWIQELSPIEVHEFKLKENRFDD